MEKMFFFEFLYKKAKKIFGSLRSPENFLARYHEGTRCTTGDHGAWSTTVEPRGTTVYYEEDTAYYGRPR